VVWFDYTQKELTTCYSENYNLFLNIADNNVA